MDGGFVGWLVGCQRVVACWLAGWMFSVLVSVGLGSVGLGLGVSGGTRQGSTVHKDRRRKGQSGDCAEGPSTGTEQTTNNTQQPTKHNQPNTCQTTCQQQTNKPNQSKPQPTNTDKQHCKTTNNKQQNYKWAAKVVPALSKVVPACQHYRFASARGRARLPPDRGGAPLLGW